MIAAILISLAIVTAPFVAGQPEEAMWSPILYAVLLAGAAISLIVPGKSTVPIPRQVSAPVGAMGLFTLLSVVSLAYHALTGPHGRALFMDAMIRQTVAYLALVAMAAAIPRVCAERKLAYLPVMGLVVAATAVAVYGLQDYMSYVAIHQADHREFGTSTPDYFACFLVMTIPITLALLVGTFGKPGKLGPLIYGVSLLVQLPVLAATGSRFAIIALLFGLISLAVGVWIASRSGLAMPKVDRRILMLAALIVVLGGAVAGHTILKRVVGPAAKAQNNSIMFRWWTWKGCERTALANPVLGTGPGTFPFAYQKYAYVGFTRAAHDSYFQATTDTGIPAAILLAFGLFWVYRTGMRSVSRLPLPQAEESIPPQPARRGRVPAPAATPEPTIGRQLAAAFLPDDDRILVAGLASGFLAGLVHNLFDSDWYVTFDAITMWGIAGALLAFARHALGASPSEIRAQPSAARVVPGVMTAALYAACAVVMVAFSVAQTNADAARSADSAADALSAYQSAISINPTRGSYYSDLGYNVYQRMGDNAHAESSLKHAIDIEPDATNYRRLGKLYLSENRPVEALAQFKAGIEAEWNDLELYLLSADAQNAAGDKFGALTSYRNLAAMQFEKIGLYPALGDIVEIRYAQADVPLGDDALAQKNYDTAVHFYGRALPLFTQYCDQDGTDGQRQSLTGGRPDPQFDTTIYTLYKDALTGAIQADNALGRPADAAAIAAQYGPLAPRFEDIIKRATKATGA